MIYAWKQEQVWFCAQCDDHLERLYGEHGIRLQAGHRPADDEVDFNPADYEDWSIEDLKAEIAEWGGEPKKRAKKSELINQFVFDDWQTTDESVKPGDDFYEYSVGQFLNLDKSNQSKKSIILSVVREANTFLKEQAQNPTFNLGKIYKELAEEEISNNAVFGRLSGARHGRICQEGIWDVLRRGGIRPASL